MLKYLFSFFIFFWCNIELFSQEYQFRNFSAADGLVSSQVNTIFQDSRGYLWLGTRAGGMSCYNSKVFTNYTAEEGLLDNQITAIGENKVREEIWAGTIKGISIITKGIVSDSITSRGGLPSENITALLYYPDKEAMLIGTIKGLSIQYKDTLYSIFAEGNKDVGAVKKIYHTAKNQIIIVTNEATWILKENVLLKFNIEPSVAAGESFLYEDKKGGLWFYNDKGLTRYFNNRIFDYSIATGLSYHLVSGITEDLLGNFWAALDIGGINKIKLTNDGTASYKFIGTESGLANTRVYTAFTDREGNLWFGTDAGVSRLSDQNFLSYTTVNGLPNNYINGIMEDSKGQIWVATAGGGASVFRNDVLLKNYDQKNGALLSPYVLATHEDKNGNIWFGTWGGYVSVFDGIKFKHLTEKDGMTVDKVYSLAEDRKNEIMYIGLVGGGIGIYRQNVLEKILTVNNGLVSNVIYAMFMDSKNRLWIGTKDGLSIYENGLFSNYTKDNGLLDNNISDIHEDSNGNIWISGGHGINCFDGKNFRHYSKKQGIKDANFCLEDDEGNIWVGTSSGLVKISFQPDGKEHFQMITTAHGLVGSETIVHSKLKDSRGHLWFGTTQGLSKYIPENNFLSNHQPLLYIDKIVTETNYSINNGEEIDYSNRNITFYFTGIWFKDDINLEYSCKLDGFDEDWLSGVVIENYIRYTNLLPGTYTFKVKTKNSSGVWSEEKQFSFSIIPPYWQRSWFYLLVIFVALSSIYGMYKIKVKNMIDQKRKLELLIQERTKEVVHQREEIKMQKEMVDQKNKNITDSLNYAKNIQEAILPFEDRMQKALNECFVLFKPKDIVSGDFYWFTEKEGKIFLAVVDCTGHGVPGAFMSMIGSAILNHIVGEMNILRADLILIEMHKQIRWALKQHEGSNRDGMDLNLCVIDKKKKQLEFAGAMNPLLVLREGTLEIIKGDKYAIGGLQQEEERIFTLHKLNHEGLLTIYLTTDGFADQFGGPKGKKFKYAQLKELLLLIYEKPMQEQREILIQSFEDWKGNLEQVDDVCIIGVRV